MFAGGVWGGGEKGEDGEGKRGERKEGRSGGIWERAGRGTEGIFREVQCWKFKLDLNVLEIDYKIGECFMIGD